MTTDRSRFLALTTCGALISAPIVAQELRWNWPPGKSYLFEQVIEVGIYFVDDDQSSRSQIDFSQTVTATARQGTDGAKVTTSFSEPHFRARFKVDGGGQQFDSRKSAYAGHPAWPGVQSDLAALRNLQRVTVYNESGRGSVVSGLGTYPRLSALSTRGLLGKHSEALLGFSTAFLPDKSVQPGDTWRVDLPDLFEDMLELNEPIKAVPWSAEVRYDKVVTRWKRKHARISYHADIDLAGQGPGALPFARYSLSGSFLWDLDKGLEVESEMTVHFRPHPGIAAQASKERFRFAITSTGKQRLLKVQAL